MITLYRLPRNKETSKDERNRKICADARSWFHITYKKCGCPVRGPFACTCGTGNEAVVYGRYLTPGGCAVEGANAQTQTLTCLPRAHEVDSVRGKASGAHGTGENSARCARGGLVRTGSAPCARRCSRRPHFPRAGGKTDERIWWPMLRSEVGGRPHPEGRGENREKHPNLQLPPLAGTKNPTSILPNYTTKKPNT